MKKLNLNTAIAKRFCSKSASCPLFAQRKGAKKKAAEFDAELFLP
jgi:hypothetical protein